MTPDMENENAPLLSSDSKKVANAILTNNLEGQQQNVNAVINTDLENNIKAKKYGITAVKVLAVVLFAAFLVLAFIAVTTALSLWSMKQSFFTNQSSLKNLTVTEDNVMELEVNGFIIPSFVSSATMAYGWKHLFQPFIKTLKPRVFLPDCDNQPTIPLDLDFDIEFKSTNNSIVPTIRVPVAAQKFIPHDFSHTVCKATEEYVITPLDLLIEYIGRNKEVATKDDDVFWQDDVKFGIDVSGLKFLKKDKIVFPLKKSMVKSSPFVQNLEVLKKVEFENTKFDMFAHKVSGDFFIEISLSFLKNIDIINFKMLKGDFFISLAGSSKKMMRVEIPDWQKCTVKSIQEDKSKGLDMLVELKLKDADVEILDDNDFTKFGRKWLIDKKVDVTVDSDIDLIISDDEWLGSMVLRHLKSTDSTTLKN